MELKPHFRVVQFSPAPEFIEPVNVALLVIDQQPRLITDNEFAKLNCVAPRYNSSLLRFLLDGLRDELASVRAEEAYAYLASRTGQLCVGEPHLFKSQLNPQFESKLIDIYLKRQTRPHSHVETHSQYVDTLLEDALKKYHVNTTNLLRRAKPEDFLSTRGQELLSAKTIHFSRVLNSTKRLVLMDGLNLSVSSKSSIRTRSQALGFAFYSISRVREQLEKVERRGIVRASLIFGKGAALDPELNYCIEQVQRDCDIVVDSQTGENANVLADVLKSASEGELEV